MPLPKPVRRQQKHHREISVRGFEREDGLWDIEAHLRDTKSYSFDNHDRDYIAAGEPIHDMWLRLTFDENLTVKDVAAVTENGPFTICPKITENFKRLIGEQIKPGWTKRTRQLLGSTEGCTHLLELLGPVATTAFQTIYGGNQQKRSPSQPKKKPMLLNSCHAFADDGEVVARLYPEHYKPKA